MGADRIAYRCPTPTRLHTGSRIVSLTDAISRGRRITRSRIVSLGIAFRSSLLTLARAPGPARGTGTLSVTAHLTLDTAGTGAIAICPVGVDESGTGSRRVSIPVPVIMSLNVSICTLTSGPGAMQKVRTSSHSPNQT